MPRLRIDLSFEIFGKWIVLEEADPKLYSGNKIRFWLCRCECGRESKVNQYHLQNGRSKQCRGCAAKYNKKLQNKINFSVWANNKGSFLDSLDDCMLKASIDGGYEFHCRETENSDCVIYKSSTASGAIKSAINHIHGAK